MVKRRGRPKKLELTETRRRLQQLFFDGSASNLAEIMALLGRIADASELSKEACEKSKLGILLKTTFCGTEHETWQQNPDLLQLVQQVANKIINAK